MTTLKRTCFDVRDTAPALHFTGRPKTFVEADENLVYEKAKYFIDIIQQDDRRNIQMSIETRLRQKAASAETQMPDEMKQLKHKEFVDKMRRQQLRNDCEELRELAEQLRLANITKELEEHMAQINRNRQLAMKAKALGLQRAETERQQQLATERAQELFKKEQQQNLRSALSMQIEERRRDRELQYVLTLTDREERMAMQRQIEEEAKIERINVERLKVLKRTDMIKCIEKRKEFEQLQRAKCHEDITLILAKQIEMADEKRIREEAKLEVQRKQQEISLRIGQQVLEVEDRKRQRDNLLLELLQAEYKAKDDERYRQQLEQEQTERRRARQELDRYRADVFQRKVQDALKKKEEVVDQNIMCAGHEDIEEKALDERRRRKEHGSLLLSMIEENKQKRAEAAAEQLHFFAIKAKSEAEMHERIQEERLQMLSSVPPGVLQYLPKQVLSETDRKYFNIQKKTISKANGFTNGPQ